MGENVSMNEEIRSDVYKLIQAIYDQTIRQYLPQKLGVRNGVAVRNLRLFDRKDFIPEHEQEYIRGLESIIRSGDKVTLIGGGWGVSTVISSQLAGRNGRVTVFEGSDIYRDLVEETVEINRTPAPVSVQYGVVGEAINLFTHHECGDIVSPAKLSSCDVLGLDCEGTELDIIDRMTIRPRNLVVEYHPCFGVKFDDIERSLSKAGYNISECIASQSERVGYLIANHR